MIYTVTMNPSIDYVMRVGEVRFGATNRSEGEALRAGGKGVNVARMLGVLGVPCVALGFVAGRLGETFSALLAREGVRAEMTLLSEGETRINVKLAGRDVTEINARGPIVSAEDVARLERALLARLGAEDVLVLGGSLPQGCDADTYARLISSARACGARCVVDTSGVAFRTALAARPFLVKPNLAELEELLGYRVRGEDALLSAVREVRAMGAESVLASLGGEGALLLDADGVAHRVAAHPITPISTVGAGDAMLAGFLAGLPFGYAHALALGNAAGAATVAAENAPTSEAVLALLAK